MARIYLLRILAICATLAICHAQMECDFETDMCGYVQDSNNDFDWVRQDASNSVEGTGTGPPLDKTTGTTQGNYLYASALTRTSGDRTRIITPPRDASQQHCIQFYYYMYGTNTGSLKVYVRKNDSTELGDAVYTKEGQQGKGWYRGLITIGNTNTADGRFEEVIFEARIGSGKLADIAIDDIQVLFDDDPCPLDAYLGDFESGYGGMLQDKTDDFNFVRKKGTTSSIGTGPSVDHTTGTASGWYVYIEATGLTSFNRARLITPTFRGVQENDRETFCVIFWYHMYGETVGELNVYLRNSSSTDLGSPIWYLGGNRGDRWRAGEAEINTPEDFQLYFEAIRGSSYTSDIALDDIAITSYGCPGHHIINNVSSVSCDFEEVEICYYKQDTTDDFDWQWRNRGGNDKFSGPDFDHTLQNELGFFVFITSNYRLDNTDKARLISPPIKANAGRSSCIEFWYHMFGRDVETLNVYIRPVGGSLSSASWTKTGDQGNYWHRQTVTVPASSSDYEVVFEGSPGVTTRDDIALDDIALYSGQDCPIFTTLPPPTTTPPPISDSMDCDFETDWCGYTNMGVGDQMDWARYQGTGPGWNDNYGPQNDHTLGNSKGYYASFDPYSYDGARLGDFAILVSPLMARSSQDRCMQFYASMNGYSVDYLNLYIQPYGATRPLDPPLAIYGNHGESWFIVQMDIPSSVDYFQVLFQAICGTSAYSGEIAIDDVKLVNGRCNSRDVTPAPVPWNADCDFEADEDLCGYYNYQYADFEWTRHTGRTGSSDTGPMFDHTLGTERGHYVYIEASYPQRPGDNAVLRSPILNSRGSDICVRFYYFAHGDDIGLLTVSVYSQEIFRNQVVFTLNGPQGEAWRPANVDLPRAILGLGNFEVRFEGRKGDGFKGDLALDDIKFLSQPCSGYPTESKCTFEQGADFCDYTVGMSSTLYWKWYDLLATEDPPLNSVTTSFMYVEGSGLNRGRQAMLYTNIHDLLGADHCLTADFVLTNDASQSIAIDAIEKDTRRRHAVGTLTGDMSSSWFRGNWSIPNALSVRPFQDTGQRHAVGILSWDMNASWFRSNWSILNALSIGSFQFVFTATAGSSGVMAIDNIVVSSQLEACARYIPPPTKPPTNRPTDGRPTNPITGMTEPTGGKPTTKNPPSREPQTGGAPTGAIVGAVIGVLAVVVIVVVIVFVVLKYRSGSNMPFGISYKNEKLDEIPFSGVKPGTGAGAGANPSVVFNTPVSANGSSA